MRFSSLSCDSFIILAHHNPLCQALFSRFFKISSGYIFPRLHILVNTACPIFQGGVLQEITIEKEVQVMKRLKKRSDVFRFILGILLVLFFNIFVICLVTTYHEGAPATLEALSKVGSQGSEVRAIQQKLADLGYGVTVDGIYGSYTKKAVMAFQKANGLTADGIAGDKTLAALGISSGGSSGGGTDVSPIGSFSSNDISLLARIISAEARGEPYEGQVAVGAVILNRIEHPSFPNTLAGVIYQPGAFSCLDDGGVNAAVADSAYRAARDAINGYDPSGGAIYYYNPAKSTNKWIFSRPVITVIGSHRFCS